MDDVQLIQILINRYIDFKAVHYVDSPKDDARVVDESGGQIKTLKIGGRCGARTLAAILPPNGP